jgi:glycosidase
MSNETHKLIIYQMMFHLWGNTTTNPQKNGNSITNGTTKFNDVSNKALNVLRDKGFTHLYTTGIIEHATKEDYSKYGCSLDHPSIVKGSCGSPFAIKDYYDVNPFLANKPENRLEEFKLMVERIHENKLKIILDFVPNHLARNYQSDKKPEGVTDFGVDDRNDVKFSPQNNFYYLPGTEFTVPYQAEIDQNTQTYVEIPAKASGNNVFSSQPTINDWFETVKLNYGIDYPNNGHIHFDPIPDTWHKMLEVLTYWTNFGVDGFRCDMAEMVPVEFWAFVIPKIKSINPDLIFIAEIYQPSLYVDYIFKGHFDYLYDKVGLYDSLRSLMEQKHDAHTSAITKVWQQESGEFSNKMLRFLENHDETRINSPGFAGDNIWSTIPAMLITATLHGGPFMIYFGQEFGEKANEIEGFNEADDRTTMFDFWRVDSHQRWLNNGAFNHELLTSQEKELDLFYQHLFKFVKDSNAVQIGQFFDLQYVQRESYPSKFIYSYLRYTNEEKLLFVNNFHSTETFHVEIIIPDLAFELMGHYNINWEIQHVFTPPTVVYEKHKISNKISLEITPNSSIILKAI